jgi:hypothetical protein
MFVDFRAPFVTVSKGHCRNDSICSLVSANRWNYKNSFSESLKLCSNRWNYSQIAETNFAETNFAESKKWQKLKISENWRTSTNFSAKNTRTHVFRSFYRNSLLGQISSLARVQKSATKYSPGGNDIRPLGRRRPCVPPPCLLVCLSVYVGVGVDVLPRSRQWHSPTIRKWYKTNTPWLKG